MENKMPNSATTLAALKDQVNTILKCIETLSVVGQDISSQQAAPAPQVPQAPTPAAPKPITLYTNDKGQFLFKCVGCKSKISHLVVHTTKTLSAKQSPVTDKAYPAQTHEDNHACPDCGYIYDDGVEMIQSVVDHRNRDLALDTTIVALA